jgi:hypothetical protein
VQAIGLDWNVSGPTQTPKLQTPTFSFTKLAVINPELAQAIADGLQSAISKSFTNQQNMMKAICKLPYIHRSSFEPPVIIYARLNCEIIKNQPNLVSPVVPEEYLPEVVDKFRRALQIIRPNRKQVELYACKDRLII